MFNLTKSGLRKNTINRRGVELVQRLARSTVASYDNAEHQYIQISKIPTLHFQASLPRLPIPKLEDTCRRYIDAQKPLLDDKKLQNTSSCVSKFLANEGQSLQKQLLHNNAENSHTSYISELWFDMYLRDRKPLPINYNPFLVFVPESDPKYDTQLVKATNLVVSSMRFFKSLRDNILEPEVFHLNPKKSNTNLFRNVTRLIPPSFSYYGAYLFKAYPLDMSQYKNLFNTTRIPQLEKDRTFHDSSAKHLVVMRRGHFYAFDVLSANGTIRSPKEIAACLKTILEDDRPPNKHPVGILTTSERDQWAQTRSHLLETGNQEILKKIDSAVFALILDDEDVGAVKNNLIRTYLHADGTNRWFDKSFSLIISKDGYGGINFEHSWGDGVAILRFFQDVKADISKKPQFHPNEVDELSKENANIERLEFSIDAKSESIIKQEIAKYKEWTDRLCVDHIIYEEFGKRQCKKLGVSPDAVMQLAFQLALYTLEGKLVPTYESCSTAAFKHGRTEAIRPCTLATKAICAAMIRNNNELSKSELKKMIYDCSKAHNALTKEAVMGQGFDRHLFALRKISEKLNNNEPAIFHDSAYHAINYNILSTSTLSSPDVLAGGFGPVVLDGYGIGYMIQEKRLGAVVTTYEGSRNASKYVQTLEHAFKSIHDVLHT
ncbi:PREDICTED: carnitine O-palmitoyltransferase 2, mitochondrial-like [Dinoponera quadriceps]|uniref:Carnitine O-palmitoyltransferase 2, mitochondrial-like n=1 Tax=Dinoponera quadriceps TaxID=609295 RepID=A0A6P3YEX6_DINQU|nr:PREDICTED: carnitine O-palmitoyltransferase 2, mitochondrial-like [Dinoponera quadriceps]XP_014488999.1 PREDICTED: carnitine O-palmitoyltransferase 2, mitochondrial-like [Dinoponera quadriceps]